MQVLPNKIIADVMSGLEMPDKATVEPDRAIAIQQAIANCQPGDIVLVAGKGHETWQEIGNQRILSRLEAYYNVEKPEGASDYSVSFTIQFVFPTD